MMDQYEELIVESYEPNYNSGFHGKVHIRPFKESYSFKRWMHVECSKKMSDTNVYPLATLFKIKAKLKKPKIEGDKISIYSNYRDPIVVVK